MQFIDTHIHLQDFKPDCAPQVLANSAVKQLILVSATITDFHKISELLKTYPDKLIGAFGIHPWYWRDGAPLEELKTMLQAFPNSLIGEIGVDALREPVTDEQHQLFSKQLAIAWTFNRPVIIHAAKAFPALLLHETELKEVKYVHHGFVKNRELLNFINKTGGYIGVGDLFLKQEKAHELWSLMPKDKILFETDAPYRINETKYNEIAQENLTRLAEIANEPIEELSTQLVKNAETFLA